MKKNLRGRTLLVILPFLILYIYIILRASVLSFTHDEGISFAIARGHESWHNIANNHLLNTYLMSFSSRILGNSEFALRLPNVLAFALYLWAVAKLITIDQKPWYFILGTALLLLNPFAVEYFSLARGYGLSLGFMMISLYFLLRTNLSWSEYTNQRSRVLLKDFLLSILFASVATYANLSMINFQISLILIFIFRYLALIRGEGKVKVAAQLGFAIVLITSILPVVAGINRLLLLDSLGQLYTGAENFRVSLDSLIKASIYFKWAGEWTWPVIRYLLLGIFILGTLSLVLKRDFSSRFAWLTLLILLMVMGLYLERFLFGALFPVERTSLFLYPCIALYIHYLLDHLFRHYRLDAKHTRDIALFAASLLIINFISSINLKYARSWKYDANTGVVMKYIRENTCEGDRQYRISNHWHFEPAINYYRISRDIPLLEANREGIDPDSDFIYRYINPGIPKNFALVIQFPDTGTELLEKVE